MALDAADLELVERAKAIADSQTDGQSHTGAAAVGDNGQGVIAPCGRDR
jgi:hypothetical protein